MFKQKVSSRGTFFLQALLYTLLFLLTISCNSQYTILKGLHNSIPPQFHSTKYGIQGCVELDSSMIYDFEDVDQYDWNKLIGLKFKYFKPMQETAMIAWRWNPGLKHFEFIPYVHREGIRYMYDENIIFALPGNNLKFFIGFFENNWYITINETNNYVIEHSSTKKRSYRIVTWFGGNRVSPHKMKFRYHWIK